MATPQPTPHLFFTAANRNSIIDIAQKLNVFDLIEFRQSSRVANDTLSSELAQNTIWKNHYDSLSPDTHKKHNETYSLAVINKLKQYAQILRRNGLNLEKMPDIIKSNATIVKLAIDSANINTLMLNSTATTAIEIFKYASLDLKANKEMVKYAYTPLMDNILKYRYETVEAYCSLIGDELLKDDDFMHEIGMKSYFLAMTNRPADDVTVHSIIRSIYPTDNTPDVIADAGSAEGTKPTSS